MICEEFDEALNSRGTKRRVAALRALTRRLFMTRVAEGPRYGSDVSDTKRIYDLLRLVDLSDDKKSAKISYFLLSLLLKSKGYEEFLRHQNDQALGNTIAQTLNNLKTNDVRSVPLRGFFIKQACTLLPLVGKRESSEILISSILDEMHEEGYPKLVKTFFGKRRALIAFNNSISIWQTVFGAMRILGYVPSTSDHLSLLFIPLKSDNIILQRHACAMIRNLAGNSEGDGGLCDRITSYIEQSETEDNTCGFPFHDSLCRCYILQMLSRFANNVGGVSIEQLASIYTLIYSHIEYVDSPDRAKSIADRVRHLVDTHRSWPLKVALTSRDNNVFAATINLLSIQLETTSTSDTLFPLVLRAIARVGRFFARKHVEYDSYATDRRYLNNDIKDYNSTIELCRHLNSKALREDISSQAFLHHPHVLTQALVSLSWLNPTDDRVSLTESRGITDEFWISLQEKFYISMPHIGLEGSLSILDNLFRRMELCTHMRFDTGSSEINWTEIRPYHHNMYLSLCTMALDLLSEFPNAKTIQLTHNLWAWTDAVLRQNHHHANENSEQMVAAKISIQPTFLKFISLVVSRDFSISSRTHNRTVAGGESRLGLADPVAVENLIRDLKDYAVWILAEQALLWIGPFSTDGSAEILNTLQVALTTISLTRSNISYNYTDDRNSLRALMKLILRISSEDSLSQDVQYCWFKDFAEAYILASRENVHDDRLNPLALLSSQMNSSVAGTKYEEERGATLPEVHSHIDRTWTTRSQANHNIEVAQVHAREIQESKNKYMKTLIEAREREVTEYRTYRPENFEAKVVREDIHAQFLSVRKEIEKQKEGEREIREREIAARAKQKAREMEVEVSHEYYMSGLKEKEKLREERAKYEKYQSHNSQISDTKHEQDSIGHGEIEQDAKVKTQQAIEELREEEQTKMGDGLGLISRNNQSGQIVLTDNAPVWIPTLEQSHVLEKWYNDIKGISNSSNPENRIKASDLVKFLGKSREYLSTRRIGLEQLRALWNIVDASKIGSIDKDEFYVFVRLLMFACAGKKPSMELYYATISNANIPLPPLNGQDQSRGR